MLLITGATGHLGKEVVNQLLKKMPATEIAVLVRDAAKAAEIAARGVQLRVGDYKDPASLKEAMRGVRTLYFVSSSDLEDRFTQHKNVVEAAQAAGVEHVLYTSFELPADAGSAVQLITQVHIDTEKLLQEAGVKYTILRHGLYMEALAEFGFLGNVAETGAVFFPAGQTPVAFTSRADLAQAAVAILTSSGHANKNYTLVNSAAYSFTEIAQILSEILGREITFISPSAEEYRAKLAAFAVPAGLIEIGVSFAKAMQQGEFALTDDTLARMLGRAPKTIQEYLMEVYGK